MNTEEITDKYKFLVDLYQVTDTGKIKCTNTFFNRYLQGLYNKYKTTLKWDDLISVAIYETVKYLDRFNLENGSWEEMTEGTDLKNLNRFYSGLKPAVKFAVFWEANPTTIQKRKSKTKTDSAYSYYLDLNHSESLDMGSDQDRELENVVLQERVGEESKLSYSQDYETEQVYNLAAFIMKKENREKYFSSKFNERYELLKTYNIDDLEDRKKVAEIAGLRNRTGQSSMTQGMEKHIKKVVDKLGLEEERIIPNEEEITSKTLLYYEYFDLLESLEPEEELSELSKWLLENESKLDELLYTYLNYDECKELTRLFNQTEKSLNKNALYTITNTLYKDLEKKTDYLLEIGAKDRTLIEYEMIETDYRQFKNKKLFIDTSGMTRTV